MKIAIISDYDSEVGFSVYLDGITVEKDTILGDFYTHSQRVIRKEYKILARHIFYYLQGFPVEYGKVIELLSDYDKIIYCYNGDIEVLK